MKILMMTNTYVPIVGGIEKSIELLTERFRRKGHSVLIAAPVFEGMPEKEDHVVRVPAIRKFNGGDFSIQLPISNELNKALTDFRPDIVHSHHPFLMGDTALRIANKFQIPLVFTHHTKYEDYTHYLPLDSPIIKRFVVELSTGYANLADHVIAPSQSVHQLLITRGVESPIDVIPTGVDLNLFAKPKDITFRSRWKIPEDDFVIGHVGRLAPEKNIIFLSQAITKIMKANKRIHFLLVGKGSSQDDIQGIFRKEGLEKRVCSVGLLTGEELINAYHAMDLFAFASETETQGLVLAEAAAAGIPIVAVDSDGVREIVRDKINGRMIPRAELNEFVLALESVVNSSPEQRENMRKECLYTAHGFDLGHLSDKVLNLYNCLIQKNTHDKHIGDTIWSNTAARLRTEWGIIKNITHSAGTALIAPKKKNRLNQIKSKRWEHY
ncbi:MAG: glycosyltransferase [Candidatus Omnitrophica bacterium]|nr:glycosyltransferase [Candidatus Omnitrophota bacterium]